MRAKLLLLSASACLFPISLGAEDPAGKEKERRWAPVEFATDPGAAHPRNVASDLTGEDPVARMAAAQGAGPVRGIAAGDNGAFDYGAGSVDGAAITAATSGPAVLAAGQSAGEQSPVSRSTLYEQDPIYRVAQTSETETAQARQVAYQQQDLPAGYVEVQPGDTVFALSRRYGAKPAEIIEANRLSAPYALDIGQVLRIPGAENMAPRRVNAGYQAQAEAQPQPQIKPQVQPQAQPQATRQAEVAAEMPVRAHDVAYADEAMGTTYHTVEPGNTLYSISRTYGLDVATLASANSIAAPYELSIGQVLMIPATASQQTAAASDNTPPARTVSAESQPRTISPVYTPEEESGEARSTEAAYGSLPKNSEASRFDWPLQGRVIMSYGMSDDGRRNDGINIAAPVGTPVRAVEDGEVVYRGAELEGYGNLLLIKHADGWVSAYAHTDTILVKKGEKIRKGQIIAKVGTTGSVDQPQLHFELRHDLKPTDPVAALDGTNELAARVGYKKN